MQTPADVWCRLGAALNPVPWRSLDVVHVADFVIRQVPGRSNQIQFDKGDVVIIVDKPSTGGWWQGQLERDPAKSGDVARAFLLACDEHPGGCQDQSIGAAGGSASAGVESADRDRRAGLDGAPDGEDSRRRDFHFDGNPFLSLLKHLLKVEGGAAE